MTQLFGTDGIRGRANIKPMTAETMLHVAMAAAAELTRGDHRHKVLIGKDTRLSGYMIEQALSAGFVSMGMDVVFVGPLPTPAVAMLTRSLRCDMGVMISASHNPYQDNGIKLFGPDGYKLSDELEAAIEKRVSANNFAEMLVTPETIGRATRLDDATGRYVEYVKATFPRGQRLDGMKIAIDCANGAAYKVAPQVLWELGADVVAVATNPDGRNINADCGATAPSLLQETVVSHGADIGIALDGDADRVIIVDEKGQVVDGDQIMGLIASSWADDGLLKGEGIVATVMSNLGLERYMDSLGLNLARVPVGDRNVVEHMRGSGFNLGGEQSGHIILSDYSTTGDGLIAALQVLSVLRAQKKPASETCTVFEPCPQLLRNVRFEQGQTPLDTDEVKASIQAAERKLADSGRLLVRKSGTEPVVRVMAEGDDAALVDSVVGEVCAAIEAATGGSAAA